MYVVCCVYVEVIKVFNLMFKKKKMTLSDYYCIFQWRVCSICL